MTETVNLLTLKEGIAPKTGQNGGAIAYQILTDADSRQEVYFMITENIGARGYFSAGEAVAYSKVEACWKGLDAGKPIPAKIFRPAFVGKSANNWGFLGAILREEKLLAPIPGAVHQHLRSGDWQAWRATMLAIEGKPYVPAASSTGKAVDQSAMVKSMPAPLSHDKKSAKREKSTPKDAEMHSVVETDDVDGA